MDGAEVMKEIAEATGGTATIHRVVDVDGAVVHSFGTLSMPLRKDHWIYQKPEGGYSYPPMPLRMGAKERASVVVGVGDGETPKPRVMNLDRQQMAEMIREAGKYAARGATMNGADMDFDPDALLQNLVVGFLSYWTADGLSGDEWANPTVPWTPPETPAQSPGGDQVQATGCNPGLKPE